MSRACLAAVAFLPEPLGPQEVLIEVEGARGQASTAAWVSYWLRAVKACRLKSMLCCSCVQIRVREQFGAGRVFNACISAHLECEALLSMLSVMCVRLQSLAGR